MSQNHIFFVDSDPGVGEGCPFGHTKSHPVAGWLFCYMLLRGALKKVSMFRVAAPIRMIARKPVQVVVIATARTADAARA